MNWVEFKLVAIRSHAPKAKLSLRYGSTATAHGTFLHAPQPAGVSLRADDADHHFGGQVVLFRVGSPASDVQSFAPAWWKRLAGPDS